MCPNKNLPRDQKGIMDFDLFKKIIDECSNFARDVYLHHRGEPLLNPRIFDMISYASAAGLKTRMHTNGTLLTKDKAEEMLKSGIDMISFSVDGFTRESYEKVRVGANFEETISNIVYFANLKKQKGKRKPYIVVERIAFKTQKIVAPIEKVKQLEKELKEAGVDEIITKEEYIWAEEDVKLPENLKRQYCVCTFPWYAMVICANGSVLACPQDYRAVMKMGDVNKERLSQIWNGDAYRQLRKAFVNNLDSLTLCSKCDRLCRKTIFGLPVQYMVTFITDQLLGYNKLRRLLGTHERNL
jgi:radical SAM protein with 4Fe4S-binding SPASM domain